VGLYAKASRNVLNEVNKKGANIAPDYEPDQSELDKFINLLGMQDQSAVDM